ncbi:MAG: shikimate kinase [Clostridia bacterium]|nr:shikimate kinase [Clostridia bacterium]
MKNIYLIGMPGCGKSTIGKIISTEINRNFIDLDEYIVNQTGKSIAELFEVEENYFRACETVCLKKISDMDNMIVATGGGIIETPGNDEIMRSSGTVIFIHTTPEKIMENSSLHGRPLLAENKNRIFELFERRYEKYKSAADYIVDNMGDIKDALNKIKDLNC